jgi:hypothetical protein
MPGLVTGQAAAGEPPDPPGPPGPSGSFEGPWGPRRTYPPHEEDNKFDEEPTQERRRPATRVWATAITPPSRQASGFNRARVRLADTLTEIRTLLARIAQIDWSFSSTSPGSGAITERGREHLRNR